jgi:hypothetical protein
MATFKVGYFVGSLSTKSINRLLAKALAGLAPKGLQMAEIPFKDLPLYNYDYDANYPPVATAFKDAIASVDAVLFVTPEYNRSIPGGLKNAIDLGKPAVRQECVYAKAVRRDRDFARQDRDRGRTAAPAQHSRLLQLPADEFHRGVYPVRAGSDYRGRPGDRHGD